MDNDGDYMEAEIESEIEPDIEDDDISYENDLDDNSEDSLGEDSEDDINNESDAESGIGINSDGDSDADSDINSEKNDESVVGDDGTSSISEKMGVMNLYNKLSKKGLKNRHIATTAPALSKKNIILEKSNKPKVVYVVPESERITSGLLLKSERAQLQSIFSKQIDRFGCPEYLNDIVAELKSNKVNVSAIDIAEAAVLQRRCPLKLRRIIGENNKDELVVEEWDPNTMILHTTN